MPDYQPGMLPPRPDLIPPELRTAVIDNTAWSQRVPPQAVGMFVAAVTQWLSDPRFGVKVTSDVLDDGWNIRIQLPTPQTREDVTVPDD